MFNMGMPNDMGMPYDPNIYSNPGMPNPYSYGSGYDYMKPQSMMRRRPKPVILIANVMCPWVFFAVLFTLRTSYFRYTNETVEGWLYVCLVAVVLVYLCTSVWSNFLARRRGEFDRDPIWWAYALFMCTVAASMSFLLADVDWLNNLRPFYDWSTLNHYYNVNPNEMRGNQLMDAGVVSFKSGSKLDLGRAMGFKNAHVYCVAPIILGNETSTNYDFWAVGLDCCSEHVTNYACGEFDNPQALSGLRLLSDNQRQFYRLAVQKAEVDHNIKANHPMFFTWMSNPTGYINGYNWSSQTWFFVTLSGGLLVSVFAGGFMFIFVSRLGLNFDSYY